MAALESFFWMGGGSRCFIIGVCIEMLGFGFCRSRLVVPSPKCLLSLSLYLTLAAPPLLKLGSGQAHLWLKFT